MVSLPTLRKNLKEEYGNSADIDLIIMNELGIDKSKLFLNLSVDSEVELSIKNKILRLMSNEPVEYIIGHKEFMSLDFKVDFSTLIPRSDTETLVEELIKIYSGKKVSFFEIGTGSGCIAVSLVHYLKNSFVTACDISSDALKVAKENAIQNKASDKIKFIQHNILTGFPEFDVIPDCIVSNPPYIESAVINTLDTKVKDFEPLSALDGGEDGLDFYRKIISDAPLKKGGILAFEIGYNQGNAVSNLLKNEYSDIRIIKDLGGNDRVVIGTKK